MECTFDSVAVGAVLPEETVAQRRRLRGHVHAGRHPGFAEAVVIFRLALSRAGLLGLSDGDPLS